MTRPFVIAAKPRVCLTSVDELLARAVPAFYPFTVEPLTAGQQFASACRLMRAGPITISDATYGLDLRLHFPAGRSGYHVNIPLSGGMQSRYGNIDVTASTENAAVYAPHGETSITWSAAHSRILAVKIDRSAVEEAIEDAFGEASARALGKARGKPLAPSFDLRHGHGRSWAGLLRQLITQLDDPDSVLYEPIAAKPFVETIITGFLMAASPAYFEALAAPLKPAAIRTATEIMHAEAANPLTVAELARRSHVSVRTLQEGFRRHLGMSPMAYLRSVRLSRAHGELRAADPSRVTVGTVARRWGFTNMTRFANQHSAAYGEFPAETLRR